MRRVRDLWSRCRAFVPAWTVVGIAFGIGYLSTILTRPQFAPDSRYYAGMALWFSGDSQETAAAEVAAHSALSGWESPPADVLFGWGLVQPRVVYPALSAPFVRLWGIEGLIVIPTVATVLFLALTTVLLARRFGTVSAVAVGLLVCASPMLLFYSTAMLTESLTALWTAMILAIVWRHQRDPHGGWLLAMFVLTVVSGFTRQATLIPAGALASAWLFALFLRKGHRQWLAPAVVVGVTAVGVQLLQTWWFPTFSQSRQFQAKTGADSLGEAILKSPDLAWHILDTDTRFLAHADRALLLLLALALISMVVYWKHSESHLLLGSLVAYEIYNVTNGTPTAFRYGLPGLVFVACSVALLISRTIAASRPALPPAPDAPGTTASTDLASSADAG